MLIPKKIKKNDLKLNKKVDGELCLHDENKMKNL